MKFLDDSLEQHMKSWKGFIKEEDLEEISPIKCSFEFLEFFLEWCIKCFGNRVLEEHKKLGLWITFLSKSILDMVCQSSELLLGSSVSFMVK